MTKNIKKLPSVAVLLAAYNGVNYLKDQVDSILNQNFCDITVYISIDRSSDGTEILARKIASSDHRVKLLPYEGYFGGAAANFFRLICDVDISNFDYVAFSDQDDIWYPFKINMAIELIANTSSDCYSSNVNAFWSSGKEILINKAQKQCQYDYFFEAAGPGCTYVLKRAVVENVKDLIIDHSSEISKVNLHDWFIYAFARSRGYHWVLDPRPSMAYRQHTANQVGVNIGWQAYLTRTKKIGNGWWISQARLIAKLCKLDNDFFFKPWQRPGRLGMLWLAINSYRSRRRIRDRFFFTTLCLCLVVIGDHSDE